MQIVKRETNETLWQGEPLECGIELETETVRTDNFGRSPFVMSRDVPVRRTMELKIATATDLAVQPGHEYAVYMKDSAGAVRYTLYVTRVQTMRVSDELWVRIEGVLS